MLVAGFDVETTGLDVTKDHIIQVACVLWDTNSKTKKAKMKKDALVYPPKELLELDPEITRITGLTMGDLTHYGIPADLAFSTIKLMMEEADAIVAHNGNQFDKPMFANNCARHKITKFEKPWIDTACDIEYPAYMKTRKLVHLAAEHGFLNPFPHDALSDVMTMLSIADRYDWENTLKYALSPTLIIQAHTGFHQKELAKAQAFRWDGATKTWTKPIKDFQLGEAEKAAKEAGFQISVMEGKP